MKKLLILLAAVSASALFTSFAEPSRDLYMATVDLIQKNPEFSHLVIEHRPLGNNRAAEYDTVFQSITIDSDIYMPGLCNAMFHEYGHHTLDHIVSDDEHLKFRTMWEENQSGMTHYSSINYHEAFAEYYAYIKGCPRPELYVNGKLKLNHDLLDVQQMLFVRSLAIKYDYDRTKQEITN